ncbi:hypothetical protein DL95DRAFT_469952 [Leptodontidium sp. 2 PMI_412]|nr:hypothetical protein DL95DRAFT_469952 [Leptodontidium sp. 2 PMI_412]
MNLDSECIFLRVILVKKFFEGLGLTFYNWEMSFNQQHSIVGDDNTSGVTFLEAQATRTTSAESNTLNYNVYGKKGTLKKQQGGLPGNDLE